MRTRSLLAAALVTAAVGTPAQAGPPIDAQFIGLGCFVVAVSGGSQLITTPPEFTGIAVAAAIGYAPTLAHNPVDTTITCDIEVGGGVVSSTPATLSGPVLGLTLGQVTFSSDDLDIPTVDVCTNVLLTDNHGQSPPASRTCQGLGQSLLPPQEVIDLLAPVCALPGGSIVCDFLEAVQLYILDNLP